MKKFKRILAMGLAVMMALSICSINSLAAETQNDSFGITTTIGENHEIVREYNNAYIGDRGRAYNIDSSEDGDFTEVKSLLAELGMEQYAIDNLSDEDLYKYANSKKIVSTVSYSKVNENAETVYLSENVALTEASIIEKAQVENIYNAANGIQTSDQNTYEDSYMRVFFMTTYHWDGSYTFSTDARWLTMPTFRWKDAIGASAQHCTVSPTTRSGYVEYDRWLLGTGVDTTTSHHSVLSSSLFEEVSDGTFYGSGAVIDLPFDALNTGSTSMYYLNYKAHYQYDGHVLDPATAHYFNAVGSYSHSKANLSISPSLSIGADGVAGAIGISFGLAQDVRKVLLEIYYS